MKPARTSAQPTAPLMMALAIQPGAWQRTMAEQLVAAIERSVSTSAAVSADGAPQAASTAITPWVCPRADAAQAARRLSPLAAQAPLYLRCLAHYRDDLRPQDTTLDDAGAALACLLAAAMQSIEGHAVTPERWGGITQWLLRELTPQLDWASAPVAEQQDMFARWALLAVALGEWSLEASKRGGLAQDTARLMARQHLEHEFGLDGGKLLAAMRWAGLIG